MEYSIIFFRNHDNARIKGTNVFLCIRGTHEVIQAGNHLNRLHKRDKNFVYLYYYYHYCSNIAVMILSH